MYWIGWAHRLTAFYCSAEASAATQKVVHAS